MSEKSAFFENRQGVASGLPTAYADTTADERVATEPSTATAEAIGDEGVATWPPPGIPDPTGEEFPEPGQELGEPHQVPNSCPDCGNSFKRVSRIYSLAGPLKLALREFVQVKRLNLTGFNLRSGVGGGWWA